MGHDSSMELAEAKGAMTLAKDALQGAVEAAELVVGRELKRLEERRDAQRDARKRRRVLEEGEELLSTAEGRLKALDAILLAGTRSGTILRRSEADRKIQRAARRLRRSRAALRALEEQEGEELSGSFGGGVARPGYGPSSGNRESKSGDASDAEMEASGAAGGKARGRHHHQSSGSEGDDSLEEDSQGSGAEDDGAAGGSDDASPLSKARREAHRALRRARAQVRREKKRARR